MATSWNYFGHDWAVRLLKGQIAAGNLRHAYLFTGPVGVGRRTLALRLAQALNCTTPPAPGEFCGACRACRGFAAMQHADLLVVKRQEEDRDILIDAIRELISSLSRTPLEARIQVALLLNFQLASIPAANALLKTLEEPNPSVLLCLTAPDADALPETVVSRCEVIRLRPAPAERLASELSANLKIDPEEAKLLAGISGGRPGLAVHMHREGEALEQRNAWLDACEHLLSAKRVERFAFAEKTSKDKDRDGLRDLLLVWLSFWRDALLRSTRPSSSVSNVDRGQQLQALVQKLNPVALRRTVLAIEHTLDQLTTNVNARLALEVLLLDFPSV